MKIEIVEVERLKKDIKELELTWVDFILPVIVVAVFFLGMHIFRYFTMIGGMAIWLVGFSLVIYCFDKSERKKSYYYEDDEYDEDEDDEEYDD